MRMQHAVLPAHFGKVCKSLAVAVTLLAGCATPPLQQSQPAAERSLVAAFTLEGRIAASDGSRNANGSLVWEHAPSRDEWSALSPMGQIVARLSADAGGALLETQDGQRRVAADIDGLLPELVGVQLPVEALRYWVQAVPRRGARILALDPAGRPARISDAGWIIDYARYADDTPGAHPARLDAQWGETRIRLLIDQWIPTP